jgi:tetratricopeptide (TPR) repeat protein
VALGRDTTLLREILDKTAERMGKDLTNEPEVELELRDTIGKVYYDLGQYTEAIQMHRRALELARSLYGNENIQVADISLSLAWDLRGNIINDEAEKLCREALAIRRRLLGNKNLAVANTLNCLGDVLRAQGKHVEAESSIREGLNLYKELTGSNNLHIAASLLNLGLELNAQGKLAEAETFEREALEMQKQLLGNTHPKVALFIHDLGSTLFSEGKLAEAENLCREGLELNRRFIGNDHPETVNNFNRLIWILRTEGKTNEAEQLLAAVQPPAKGFQPFLMRSTVSWRIVDSRFAEAAADLAKLVEANPEALSGHAGTIRRDKGPTCRGAGRQGLSVAAGSQRPQGGRTAGRYSGHANQRARNFGLGLFGQEPGGISPRSFCHRSGMGS